MISSTLTMRGEAGGQERPPRGFHVAIIMDGNGRWAQKRRRPRRAGHVAGAAAVRRTTEAAPSLGITTLTLYAFSADNWRRPRAEVDHLMRLFQGHLRSECAHCVDNGVRLSVIGRRDRLPAGLEDAIEAAESRTKQGTVLHLRIAIDYSARDAIVTAAASMPTTGPLSREVYSAALAQAMNSEPGTRDVDLLIRTGGERRLSDFLLWESAYAELVFTDKAWPDFTARDLESAVREFSTRDRRFGGLAPPAHAQLGQPPMEGGTGP
ncbi:MAG: di-trans,poly-cis-decaprenylcistransferase [Longimicrobiales bacterium]|nr:di-trans,poly-cis-decaprenylcistransferase [Longimicrobiales bacterium]